MQGFYNITTVIKNQLLQDPFCNTVTIGDLFEVDLRKQTIFPLSHIIVNSADLENNVWRFNMSVISMDIVDKSKELTTDHFTGNDNEHDVLNTQHAVLNRLLEVLRRGSLYEEHYHLDGNPSLEPFTERFENYLAGWTATFDVLIPNDMTACDGFETPTVLCENGVVTIKDSEDNVLYTLNVPSGSTLNQEIQDSTAVLKNTDDTILSTTSILAEGSENIIAPDGHVHLKKENDGSIDNVFVPSGVTQDYVVENNDISVNGVLEFDIHATDPLDIRLRDSNNNVITPVSVTDSGNHATIVINISKDLFWELNYNATDDVIYIPATANNVGTLTSGTGSNVGTITISTDGISYSALSFPFTPVNGTTYYFKRSTATVNGTYTMTGTYA